MLNNNQCLKSNINEIETAIKNMSTVYEYLQCIVDSINCINNAIDECKSCIDTYKLLYTISDDKDEKDMLLKNINILNDNLHELSDMNIKFTKLLEKYSSYFDGTFNSFANNGDD